MATKTGKIEVLNYKTHNIKGALCIMQSKGATLGNPFYKGSYLSPKKRQESIAKFRQYLWENMQNTESNIMKEITRLTIDYLRGKTIRLYCCCAPLPCHGDVIKSAIIWLATETLKKKEGLNYE